MNITLKTLPQATAQEVFDQVTAHLLKQNKQSNSHGNIGCMYRNKEGLKCAAGCLIGDDEYSSRMEGAPWDVLVSAGVVPDTHVKLIERLQCVHDAYGTPLWLRELRSIARQFGLKLNA